MSKQSSARSWAMLSWFGLLTCAAGCQSQTAPTEAASSAASSPVQPSEAVDPTMKRAEPAIDSDVQRTSREIEGAHDTPSPVAPTVDQAVVEVDKSVKEVADDLKSNATQAAGEITDRADALVFVAKAARGESSEDGGNA